MGESIGEIYLDREGTAHLEYDKKALAREVVRQGGGFGQADLFEIYIVRKTA